ncbi:MAG: hypothetical protein ACK46X_12325 [Candidatus Sericytochromatia bacterium]
MRHLLGLALLASATPALPSSPAADPAPLTVTWRAWSGVYHDVTVHETPAGLAVSPGLLDFPRWHGTAEMGLRGPKASLHVFNQTTQPVKLYLREKGDKPIDRLAPNQWSHLPLELGSYHLRGESPGRAFGPVKVIINPDFETTLLMK